MATVAHSVAPSDDDAVTLATRAASITRNGCRSLRNEALIYSLLVVGQLVHEGHMSIDETLNPDDD